MAYDYAARSVWLEEIAAPVRGTGYALCEYHANRMTAPRDWTLTDRRLTMPPLPGFAE